MHNRISERNRIGKERTDPLPKNNRLRPYEIALGTIIYVVESRIVRYRVKYQLFFNNAYSTSADTDNVTVRCSRFGIIEKLKTFEYRAACTYYKYVRGARTKRNSAVCITY